MAVINDIIRVIRPYMKEKGFLLRNRCFYCIEDDLAYCVEFEMPSHLVYVNCYIIPLYVPTEFRYYTYGIRLKEVLVESYEQQCMQLKATLETSIFPVFVKIKSPHNLLKLIDRGLFKGGRIPKVDVYRLRLFTAFYEKDINGTLKLCDEYKNILLNTPYLTADVKKNRIREILEIRNRITQANEAFVKDIIKNTKRTCFGIGKTGDDSSS